ncbi:hypothetical protein F5Y12DRAFT_149301 [Xylaria sp. FL1777]|nr:hypothetical protein F5Y12DRAFT_149301 [Xylaria sp. FL1777]
MTFMVLDVPCCFLLLNSTAFKTRVITIPYSTSLTSKHPHWMTPYARINCLKDSSLLVPGALTRAVRIPSSCRGHKCSHSPRLDRGGWLSLYACNSTWSTPGDTDLALKGNKSSLHRGSSTPKK